MKSSRAVTLMAILSVLALIAVPAAADDSDAADIVSVSLSGGDIPPIDPIDVVISNGGTATIKMFIINETSSYVNLQTKHVVMKDQGLEISATYALLDGSSAELIRPHPDADSEEVRSDYIAVLTVTITADIYADPAEIPIEYGVDVTYMFGSGADDAPHTLVIPLNITVDSTFYSGDAYNRFFGVFPNTLDAPLNSPWFTAAVTMAIWIVATILVSNFVIPVFTKMAGNRKTDVEKKSIKRGLTETVTLLMIVIAFNECAQIVGASAELIHTISSVSNVLYVMIGALISWQIYLFIITAILNGLDEAVDMEGIDMTLLPLFKMLGKLIIGVAAVTLILATFGVDLAGIMVSAGVVTLGITFGAQEMLNQFFSGIVLLSTRPFKKGDYVQINNDVYVVHRVRLMFTEFENWDKDRIVTMPNNVVSAATITNLTRGSPHTRIFIYVTVAYDADLTKAKELMIKAAKMHPHTLKDDIAPIGAGTRLTRFMDSGIEYRLAVFVDDFDNSSHYAGQIREIMYKLFKDGGIEIPYNRVEVTFRDDGKRRPYDNGSNE